MNGIKGHDEAYGAFLKEPVGSLLVKNCGPALVSMLVMAMYQMVDGVMVGRRLGPEALAAVNILYPVIALLVGLAVMIGVGGNARVAVLLGAGKTREARGVFSLAVALGAGVGLSGTVVFMLFSGQLTLLLGAVDGVVAELAMRYLLTMAPFFTAYILSFILDQAVRNDGRAGFATGVMASGAVLNIVLDYVFLFVLDWGIAGAALASAIGQSVSATVFVGYFVVKLLRQSSGLRLAVPRGGLSAVTAIAGNGSSELLGSLALGVVTLMFNRSLMLHTGAVGVAAFALVQYVLILSGTFFNALGTGSQPIISRNYGAGLHHRVMQTLRLVLGAGLFMSAGLAVASYLAAGYVALLFVPGHPEAVLVATRALRIVAFSIPAAAVGTIGTVFFTSIERAGMSLVTAATRGLIVPVLALSVVPQFWGELGIWFVPVLTELSGAGITLFLLTRWAKVDQYAVSRVILNEFL